MRHISAPILVIDVRLSYAKIDPTVKAGDFRDVKSSFCSLVN